ncbi:MAG: hypothetical protein WC817_03085 [Patescibacteria group bacterium]|jgi:nicotinamide mononucleotide adenylyltransferase
MIKVVTVHGRFQPPLHKNHWNYIKAAFGVAEKVIILITNPNLSEKAVPEAEHRNKADNNPLSYDERVKIFKSFFDNIGIAKNRYEFKPFDITDEKEWRKLDKGTPNMVNVYSDWSNSKLEKFKTHDLKVIRLDLQPLDGVSGTRIREIIWRNIDASQMRNELLKAGYMEEAIPGLFEVLGY